MIDPVSLTGGAAIFLGGIITGRIIRRGGDSGSRRPPVVMCSCGHGYGTYDADDGACNGQVKRESEWDAFGNDIGYEWIHCPCRAYDGPEPLPRSWTPFLLPPKSGED